VTDLIANLAGKLDQCMLADRPRLERRLRSLHGEGGGGHGKKGRDRGRKGSRPESLEAVADAIEASRERARRRAETLPLPKFPADLPVAGKREEIASTIRDNQVVIICGETGSGKTTQLPKICLELGRGVRGLIGHTQPRRIAARSVAVRIAEELGDRACYGGAM
jgi:ATP-dependent helicase HrpA